MSEDPAGEDEDEPGTSGAPKPVSQKIEEAIDGFVEFGVAFLRTMVRLIAPWTVLSVALAAGRKGRRTLLPYTFLVTAYFPWSVILVAAASSYWEVLLSPETAASDILAKLSTSVSPAKLLTEAIPALGAVLLGGVALGWIMQSRRIERELLRRAFGYAFGFHFLALSSLLVLLLGTRTEFLTRLTGLDSHALDPLSNVSGLLFRPLAVYGIAYPALALGAASWTLYRRRLTFRAARTIATIAFVAVLVLIVNYIGWFPAAVQEAAKPETPAGVGLDIDTDEEVDVTRGPDGRAIVAATVLLDNQTGNRTAVKRTSFRLSVKDRLAREHLFGQTRPTVDSEPATVIRWSDGEAPFMVLEPGALKWARLRSDSRFTVPQLRMFATDQRELLVQATVHEMGGHTDDSEWRTPEASFSAK